MFRLVTKILVLLAGAGVLTANTTHAALSMRWTSVAGVILDDGETTVGFDLVFTRPGILQWAGLRDLVPNPRVIEEHLAALELRKLDALFVSHTHFDHVTDAPWIANRYGAILYGGPSLARISRANERRFGWKSSPYRQALDRAPIRVGRFEILPYQRKHAAIFPHLSFHFLKGPVPETFDFGFDDYREGETWGYVISHPEGKILIDQGGQIFEGIREELGGVRMMAVGVANKTSEAEWLASYVAPYRPEIVIPLHFDWFFSGPRRGRTWMLPGTGIKNLQRKTTENYPKTRFVIPNFGERIELPSALVPVVVPALAAPTAEPSPLVVPAANPTTEKSESAPAS